LRRGSLGWRSRDHKLEALFCRRELRNIMFGVCSSNVLLHGAIPLFLPIQTIVTTYDLQRAMEGYWELQMQDQVQQSEHSRRDSACDSWNHLDCAKDTQPHCWRRRPRRTMSALIEASPRLTPPCDKAGRLLLSDDNGSSNVN
jgi:hypothetical protein